MLSCLELFVMDASSIILLSRFHGTTAMSQYGFDLAFIQVAVLWHGLVDIVYIMLVLASIPYTVAMLWFDHLMVMTCSSLSLSHQAVGCLATLEIQAPRQMTKHRLKFYTEQHRGRRRSKGKADSTDMRKTSPCIVELKKWPCWCFYPYQKCQGDTPHPPTKHPYLMV